MKINLVFIALFFSLPLFCSEKKSSPLTKYYYEGVSGLKDDLRYNIKKVNDFLNVIGQEPFLFDSKDDNETIDTLKKNWEIAESKLNSIKEHNCSVFSDFSDSSIFWDSVKIGVGSSLAFESLSLLNKCIDFINIFIEKNPCPEEIYDLWIDDLLGIEYHYCEDNYYRPIDVNLLGVLAIGAIGSGVLYYKHKKYNEIIREHPEYLTIKHALKKVNLKPIDL